MEIPISLIFLLDIMSQHFHNFPQAQDDFNSFIPSYASSFRHLPLTPPRIYEALLSIFARQ